LQGALFKLFKLECHPRRQRQHCEGVAREKMPRDIHFTGKSTDEHFAWRQLVTQRRFSFVSLQLFPLNKKLCSERKWRRSVLITWSGRTSHRRHFSWQRLGPFRLSIRTVASASEPLPAEIDDKLIQHPPAEICGFFFGIGISTTSAGDTRTSAADGAGTHRPFPGGLKALPTLLRFFKMKLKLWSDPSVLFLLDAGAPSHHGGTRHHLIRALWPPTDRPDPCGCRYILLLSAADYQFRRRKSFNLIFWRFLKKKKIQE
jgi:hypothetical protein